MARNPVADVGEENSADGSAKGSTEDPARSSPRVGHSRGSQRSGRRRVLELGGGRDPATDGVNVDIAPVAGVDVLADVTAPWPFAREAFDRIEAHHVLEHVPHEELPVVFREAAATLRPGGEFFAEVPLAHSRSAVNDPTHESTWYWRTPAYYTEGDELSYEVGADAGFVLDDRTVRLFLTSGEWYARPPSWLLKQWSQRNSSLIELVKLPYVTGVLEFTLRKRG